MYYTYKHMYRILKLLYSLALRILVVAHKEDRDSNRMYAKVTVEDLDDLDVYFLYVLRLIPHSWKFLTE